MSKVLADPVNDPKNVNVTIPETTSNTSVPAPEKKKRQRRGRNENQVIKDADPILKANISTFIQTANMFAAIRLNANSPIDWRFTEEEITAIADPAARIAERLGFGDAAGKYSDYFMLLFAVGGPIVGRLIAVAQVKAMTGKTEGGIKLVNPLPKSKPSTTGSTGLGISNREAAAGSRPDEESPAIASTNFTDNSIPALGDF
jgi:hypothetical protein